MALSYLLANLAKKRVILILQNNIYKDTIFLMLNKIFDIDLSYFESHSSGDIENRFNSVSDIYEFISTALISTVIDVVTAVFLRNNDDNTVNTIVCSYNSNDCYTDNNSNDFKSKKLE